MIIRMTVQDNDYEFFLVNFAKSLANGFTNNYFIDSSIENIRKTLSILNKPAGNDEAITEEDKNFIYLYINEAFSRYLKRSDLDHQIQQYLLLSFYIEIVDSFQEKWENSEYVYYFSNSNVAIVQ